LRQADRLCRVSDPPQPRGERVVLRVLDKQQAGLTLAQLGLSAPPPAY
jgi:type II secretory ATPase GspE/PulE/Tfp pilus assembly ATPase PilB-like protein